MSMIKHCYNPGTVAICYLSKGKAFKNMIKKHQYSCNATKSVKHLKMRL